MLDDVVANFLGTLSEVEFFDAFAAILRANDFFDINLTHGTSEHGKDFIAKRVEGGITFQYGIQTKVGNTNTSGWREVRDQIETIRTSSLSHPSFDEALPRKAVLATTGRLIAQATTESQDYANHYRDTTFEFKVWQLSDLLSMMTDSPETGLAGEPEAPLLGAVAAIFDKSFTEFSLEKISRLWANPTGEITGIWRTALSAFVLAHRLAGSGRRDLAALTGLHLIRAAWARNSDTNPPLVQAVAVADSGRGLFLYYANVLFDEVKALPIEAEEFVMVDTSFDEFVTYPVRCLRIIEILGLAGLAAKDDNYCRDISDFLETFIQKQDGASHPISDHWSVSLPVAVLLLYGTNRDLVIKWLQRICVWTVDHYESNYLGLAAPWSEPREEVSQLLLPGTGVSGIPRRSESFLATILLDLASSLEMPELYDELVNEIMAVRIFPCSVECNGGVGMYQDNLGDVFLESWVKFDENYVEHEGWPCSEPSRRSSPQFLQTIGRGWDLLALSSVLRDRWYPLAWRELIKLS